MPDIESDFAARGLTYAATNLFETPQIEAMVRRLALTNPPAPFSMLHYKPLSRIDIIAGVMRDLPLRRHPAVEIREAGGAGYGLFAAEEIRPGTFLGEYTGRVVIVPQAEVNGLGQVNGYLFLLGLLGPFMHEGVMSQALIDAAPAGNHTRFANHSFTPNCASGSVLLEDGWHVFLAANRVIRAGEQLVYDYGKPYWSTRADRIDL